MARASKTGSTKPKLSKEERRAKYTALARKNSAEGRQRAADRHSVCFQCRQRGHTVARCPNSLKESGATTAAGCCYKCGSTEHSLAQCPKTTRDGDDGGLPFATCFICHETGHLASQCPQNSKGIYINGGCCKECGSKQHRVTNCPERNKRKDAVKMEGNACSGDNAVDDLLEPLAGPDMAKAEGSAKGKGTKRRVVAF